MKIQVFLLLFYWLQAWGLRSLIGSIRAEGINTYDIPFSGHACTHLVLKEPNRKNNASTWKGQQKAHMAVGDNYPQNNSPLYIELMRFWLGAKRSGRKKKIPVQLLRPWRDLEVLSIAHEGFFEWNGGRKEENELLIVITQVCDSLLHVWQASFGSVTVNPVYGKAWAQ